MNQINLSELLFKIVLGSFATTGIMEYLKNFVKTTKSWVYAIIMPFIAIGCYCAVEYLPIAIIGSILTVGCVQLDYQIIIQSFKKLITKKEDVISNDMEK